MDDIHVNFYGRRIFCFRETNIDGMSEIEHLSFSLEGPQNPIWQTLISSRCLLCFLSFRQEVIELYPFGIPENRRSLSTGTCAHS